MGKHFHDPFRPHSARPAVRVTEPVADVAEPASQEPVLDETGVLVETLEENEFDEEGEFDGDEAAGGAQVSLTPPPQVGPGSSTEVWRVYAAEATGTPSQTWADATRSSIIEVLRDQGVPVDSSGVQGS